MITFLIISVISLMISAGFSQTIPRDSMYLGQVTPGDVPVIFQLGVRPGHFAAEWIAVTADGKDIYYSEIEGYYPIRSARIKKYSFANGNWTGPFVLFENFFSPALSVTGDIMYLENGTAEAYFSVKRNSQWSVPEKILSKLLTVHYLQVTHKGTFYISSKVPNNEGLGDWCKLDLSDSDTIATGLGMPLNTVWDNLDFFISRDEAFIIATTPFGLAISYQKINGTWTNPRKLGSKINFGLGMWGPYITPDNKYLFYNTGTNQDYSDVNVYWVRIDHLIDSLKYTNIPPYARNKIKIPDGIAGMIYRYTIPDDIFFDEDGDTTFTYSANLIDGTPLPSWLNFNTATKAFSGTPPEAGEIRIILTATDADNSQGIGVFKLSITDKP